MLGTDTNSRSIDESYSIACTTSDMRVEGDRRGDADVIIASGWSPVRMGSALLRLASEFDTSARPKPPTREEIDVLALSEVKRETIGKDDEGRPIVKIIRLGHKSAQAKAWEWHASELNKFMGKLKSLPGVKREVIDFATRDGIEGAEAKAPAALGWWLMQNCLSCHGRQETEIVGTARLSGRECRICHGSGKSPTPYGSEGRRIANVLDDCVQRARQSIKQRLRQFPHHPTNGS